MAEEKRHRERWKTRLGLIFAMAGNAIGLGNFLRFPVQAAEHGGGAFMIPYFVALLLLGIPLMWVEWSMGRYGGRVHHGTSPGIFDHLARHPLAKYMGAFGLLLPLIIVIYYNYIVSWTLAYSVFSLTGAYEGLETREAMKGFLTGFQGQAAGPHFGSVMTAYAFFAILIGIVTYILYRGVVRGIETLARIGMPLLFVFAVIIVVRIFTLDSPDPAHPDRSVVSGLAFLWNPDFSALTQGKVWLAAAGQIFFTLGAGAAVILTYASYLREKDDVVLNGLTTTATNEFAEIILGGSIGIVAAVVFFGAAETGEIAKGGAFDLAFFAMPVILQNLPMSQLFGTLWFFLLFVAGITSSVALSQPIMAFLQDEMGWARHKAAATVGAVMFLAAQPVIFWLGHGFLDELDFWAGTVGLALFALIEVVIFAWVFGMDKAWREITLGADLHLPRIFYYIIKYVTPTYIIILLVAWLYQSGWAVLRMEDVAEADVPYRWAARGLILGLLAVLLWLIRMAWREKVHGRS